MVNFFLASQVEVILALRVVKASCLNEVSPLDLWQPCEPWLVCITKLIRKLGYLRKLWSWRNRREIWILCACKVVQCSSCTARYSGRCWWNRHFGTINRLQAELFRFVGLRLAFDYWLIYCRQIWHVWWALVRALDGIIVRLAIMLKHIVPLPWLERAEVLKHLRL